MAKFRIETAIPHQSLIYLASCLIGILIFIFAGIIPGYRKIITLDNNIRRFSMQAEEEKYLIPLYNSLKNKTQAENSRLLPFPVKESIPRGQTDRIFMTFNEMARKTGMEVISVVPNVNSLTGNIKFLSVNVILRGDYFNFRKFLSNAGDIPYLEHIEEIEIQQIPEGKEYRIKMWLVVS